MSKLSTHHQFTSRQFNESRLLNLSEPKKYLIPIFSLSQFHYLLSLTCYTNYILKQRLLSFPSPPHFLPFGCIKPFSQHTHSSRAGPSLSHSYIPSTQNSSWPVTGNKGRNEQKECFVGWSFPWEDFHRSHWKGKEMVSEMSPSQFCLKLLHFSEGFQDIHQGTNKTPNQDISIEKLCLYCVSSFSANTTMYKTLG